MKKKIASIICVDEQDHETIILEYADLLHVDGVGEVPFLPDYITIDNERCLKLGDSNSFIVFKGSENVIVSQKNIT